MNASPSSQDSPVGTVGPAKSATGIITEWAPWLVFAGLLLLSLVGGLGGIPWLNGPDGGASSKASPEVGAPKVTSPTGEEPGGNALPAEFPTHLLARGLPAGAEAGPKTVEARHVLVQYKGSWHALAEVTRTKEDAFGLAEQARERLKKGEEFRAVLLAYTDSADVKARQGVLGVLDRDTAMRAIAQPAHALKVGEYSEVVESPFGFHVIQRTK